MKAAFLVLFYNKVNLTKRCVDSILTQGYPPESIYLFDNGSKSEMGAEVKTRYPLCEYRRIEKNRGYSGGFNEGLNWVFSENNDSAFFLTNDTLLQNRVFGACQKTYHDSGVEIIAPKLSPLKNDEKIDSIGGYFDPEKGSLFHYREEGLPAILQENDYIPGTALWLTAKAFHALKGTDESYFTYWEDADFSFRAQKAGISLGRCYEAELSHGIGQTCHKKAAYTVYYYHRNRIKFILSHFKSEEKKALLELVAKDLKNYKKLWTDKNDERRLSYLEKVEAYLEDQRS